MNHFLEQRYRIKALRDSVNSLKDKINSGKIIIKSYEDYKTNADAIFCISSEMNLDNLDSVLIESFGFWDPWDWVEESETFIPSKKGEYLFIDKPIVRSYHVIYLLEKMGETFINGLDRYLMDHIIALCMVNKDLLEAVKPLLTSTRVKDYNDMLNRSRSLPLWRR